MGARGSFVIGLDLINYNRKLRLPNLEERECIKYIINYKRNNIYKNNKTIGGAWSNKHRITWRAKGEGRVGGRGVGVGA